jgi:hypothetical protein
MAMFRPPATKLDASTDASPDVDPSWTFVGNRRECAVATVGAYVILLWRNKIVEEGVPLVRSAFETRLRKHPGEKIAFLTILEAGCELSTSANVRTDLANLLRARQGDLAAAAIVFEQHGFRMTMVRSVITAIYMASRARFPNSVFSEVTQATRWMEQEYPSSVGATQVERVVSKMRDAPAR